jgi:soluble lytic murein transglycosylase-like protein
MGKHCARAPLSRCFPDASFCQAEDSAFLESMTKTDLAVAILLASASLSTAPAGRAQIAAHVDGSGKMVYTNEDSQGTIRKSAVWPSSASAAAPEGAARASSVSTPEEAAPQARPAVEGRLDRIVREAAKRHQLDPALVKAVIDTESGWNPRAVSNKGAVGLMQLIPGTAHRFGVGNLLDPAQNVEGGATYLKTLLDRYNGDLTKSLAAYNAGERAVDRSGGVPAFAETQSYVRKVTDAYFRPGSGRNPTLWSAPRPVVRRELDAQGRTIFTNE